MVPIRCVLRVFRFYVYMYASSQSGGLRCGDIYTFSHGLLIEMDGMVDRADGPVPVPGPPGWMLGFSRVCLVGFILREGKRMTGLRRCLEALLGRGNCAINRGRAVCEGSRGVGNDVFCVVGRTCQVAVSLGTRLP